MDFLYLRIFEVSGYYFLWKKIYIAILKLEVNKRLEICRESLIAKNAD